LPVIPDVTDQREMNRIALYLLLFAFVLQASSCTTMVSRKKLPYPLTNDRFDDPVKVVTIPLPAIAASPNEGVTYGGLTAFLLHNRKDEVDTLVAPQLYYNGNFGMTGAVYGSFFLDSGQTLEIDLSKSTKVNEFYEARFRDKTLIGGKLELNAFLFYFTDGSARFFGFQSTSSEEDETNFGDREIGFSLTAGYKIADHLQFVLGERYRDVAIVEGAVTSLPFLRDVFPQEEVPGSNGFIVHAQQIALVYDSLDSQTLPTRGVYAIGSVEASTKFLGSSENYRHYRAEVKGYFPLQDARYITVARIAYNQALGDRVPFLERSILGGETTLRGYGRLRFIDSSSLLLNLEERIRLFRWNLFDVSSEWEVALFLDAGAVMESLNKTDSRSFEFTPGIGFRAKVKPNIVGRVDIARSEKEIAVFVGLGYPF
jgi:outer membrane protein assembly factor BamA